MSRSGHTDEYVRLRSKKFLWLILILSMLGISIPIFFYAYFFRSYDITDNPIDWGLFGDYFGGVLNPIISLLNLIVLSYVSFRIVDIENNRNKWTLRELSRPLAEVNTNISNKHVEITLENCGLGPMLITNLTLTEKNGQKTDSFKKYIANLPTSIKTNYWYKSGEFSIIKKDSNVILLSAVSESNNSTDTEHLGSLASEINGAEIIIEYSDVYKRPIEKYRAILDLLADRINNQTNNQTQKNPVNY